MNNIARIFSTYGVIAVTTLMLCSVTPILAQTSSQLQQMQQAQQSQQQAQLQAQQSQQLQIDPQSQTSAIGQGSTQPDRVGIHDDFRQTSGEGASAGGIVFDPTIPDGQVSANCFGKVIQHEAQEHKEPGSDEGTLGEHSSDPVPEIPGREVPRQGIGNQDQGHPAAHGAFNAQFEAEDAENVAENC